MIDQEIVASINIALICVIGMLATVQSAKRRMIAQVYALSLFIHLFTGHFLLEDYGRFLFFHHDTIFFISGAVLDFLIITYIATFYRVPELGADLQAISLVSILYNLFGWGLVSLETDIPVYNALFTVLYLYAIYTLIRREPSNVGYYRTDSRLFAFHPNYY